MLNSDARVELSNYMEKITIIAGKAGRNTRMFLDDVEISGFLRGVKFDTRYDTVSTVTLEVLPHKLEIFGMAHLDVNVPQRCPWLRFRRACSAFRSWYVRKRDEVAAASAQ